MVIKIFPERQIINYVYVGKDYTEHVCTGSFTTRENQTYDTQHQLRLYTINLYLLAKKLKFLH